MSSPPLVPQVNVHNGSGSAVLGRGDNFEWFYPAPIFGGDPALLTGCSSFCTQDSFSVPYGGALVPAQVRMDIEPGSHSFHDTAWNTPGQPHINIASEHPKHHQKEVA